MFPHLRPGCSFENDQAYARSDYAKIGIAPVQVFPGFELAAAQLMVRLLGNSIPESRRTSAIAQLMKAFQGQEGWSASSAFATEELYHPNAVAAYREEKWREEMGGYRDVSSPVGLRRMRS